MILIASGISGCATTTAPADFCLVAKPIRPSVNDTVTDGTKRQIVAHNQYGASACGWRP